MKTLIIKTFLALWALCTLALAQGGESTYIRYSSSLPSPAKQWSAVVLTTGALPGLYICQANPCTVSAQWQFSSGTITGVTAGSGLSGGGTSGAVTLHVTVSASDIGAIPTSAESGTGTKVASTNGLGTVAGVQVCTDGQGNISPTCSNVATGLGVYLFAAGKQDTGCVQFLVSEDGKQVRPLNWPLDPALGGSWCGGGTPGTSSAGGQFSELYVWNSTYYLIYDDYTHASTGCNGSACNTAPPIGIASSPDMVNWTFLTDLPVATTGYGSSAISIFYDAPAQCPAQDWTCLHVIAPMVLGSSGNQAPFELHPTNSSLTAWSTPVQLASGVAQSGVNNWDDVVINYNGTYYLFSFEMHGSPVVQSYYVFSSSSLTGTYTLYGHVDAWGWCPVNSATCTNSTQGGTEGLTIIWTGAAWRAYLHPTQALQGTYYIENTTSPVATSGWTSPVNVDGVVDVGAQHAHPIRVADSKSISIVAATARQSTLPLNTQRGVATCDNSSTSFNTPGQGGVYNGMCFGMEHVNSTQTGSGYNALRLFASNTMSGIATWQHIDLGNYTTPTAFTNWLQMTPKLATFTSEAIQPTTTTVSGLAAFVTAGAGAGAHVEVSDGVTASDCTTGGGLTKVLCVYDGSVWRPAALGHNWSVSSTYNGVIPASTYLLMYQVPSFSPTITINIPTNCAGSTLKVYTAATAASTFTIAKNGTTICTATVGAGVTTVTWGTIGGTNTLGAGDVLTVQGGGDTTLANIGLTLMGSY
jgi:hypothetical protein